MPHSTKVSLRAVDKTHRVLDPRQIDTEVEKTTVEIMFRTARPAMVAAFSASVLLIVGLRIFYRLDMTTAIWWTLVQFSTFFILQVIIFVYERTAKAARDWRVSARLFVGATFLGGLGWGLGSVVLVAPASMEEELFIVLILSALASGTVLALGSYLPATFAHFLPLILPLTLWSVTRGDAMHYFLVGLAVFYTAGISILAWMYNANLTNSLRLEIEKRNLAFNLQDQMEASERANRAKSQFLASASHDLRQPVHALSMFVGALLEKSMAADSRYIVEQMSGAVESMDGLFNSLLDISKLDAGVIKSHARPFAIRQLLGRMRSEFQAAAERKGLKLVVCDSSLVVDSDPILLENILRNLVANAIKYTKQGNVLIGCRRGSRLRIEIHDSGIGIPGEQLGRVFEEFYQVGNSERERAHGLGLGLAIVKRTAALIGCDVEMESVPGRGTHVRVFVPMARDQMQKAPPARAPRSRLEPALIFLIDDEATIREAMKGLLEGWGHTVVVAESGKQILEHASDCPRRPDLMICDYRLREDENGIQLMNRLREEYNAEIRGFLLTGDTASGRLVEAEASGYPVLHKPLSSARLLEAIETAMNDRPAPRLT